jgi:IS30 family transposase
MGCLKVNNFDLRRKVSYKQRKKKREESEAFQNQKFRQTRTYLDFVKYMEKHPDINVVEMDTVKGCREQGKRMLTLLFRKTNLMLIMLMRDGKAATVVEQFDYLTSLVGVENFRKIFPVILTDNGSEFKYTQELEKTDQGERRTRLFYCDPQASWQKAQLEKNHEYIRYVLRKGKSFNPYTQDDMVLLMNHINSTRREKLGGKSPFEAEDRKEVKLLLKMLGLHSIPSDEVNLNPTLLTK